MGVFGGFFWGRGGVVGILGFFLNVKIPHLYKSDKITIIFLMFLTIINSVKNRIITITII